MKCPLLCMALPHEIGLTEPTEATCLKEKCAWWDMTAEKCVILQLAFELDEVHGELGRLIDKMPPARE